MTSRQDKIREAIVPEQLDEYLPASQAPESGRVACADYFALPNLICGLVADHDGPHLSVPPGDRRRFRWVGLPGGRRVHPEHPLAAEPKGH